jgi:sugar/nucleoside kinase (ribokinase family)
VLLDGYKGVEELLLTGNVDILKINTSELHLLTGIQNLEEAVKHCFAKYSLEIVALTAGSQPSHLFTKSGSGDEILHHTYAIPSIPIRNAIGAGTPSNCLYRCSLIIQVIQLQECSC